MRKTFFYLTKIILCTGLFLFVMHCLFMRQTQGLCSAITIFMEPQGRQERCLLQIEVRGSGTLFDGKAHHRNSSERYALFKGKRRTFHLYADQKNDAIQIRLNNKDITDSIHNGNIPIRSSSKVQQLVLYVS
ncbi:hypothetical protein CIAN88_22145 [[Clostridium] innocuum]|uniref:Uncharacterized protein n=1 Tax=Clostridium innocuum TaxID=1522 RepID=A0A099I078_CLOIN|nr:hypothetical protein [[Clostridium] innocuum]KGJ51130.1 hypothetical protein CIAN88_22145 [[Clostridium] innocuum]MCR0161300.1 hypothetical protein [[Clostridium] innocuum]MCR0485206.1 hypothetical protein [[Clostridium] innocuum]